MPQLSTFDFKHKQIEKHIAQLRSKKYQVMNSRLCLQVA